MAENLYLSVDEDGDSFISLTEIIRAKPPKEEKKSVNEDESGDDDDDDEDEQENFIERLVKAVSRQDELFDQFEEELDLDEDMKEAIQTFFEVLKKKLWFNSLTAQQRNLLQNVLTNILKDTDYEKKAEEFQENPEMPFSELVADLDMLNTLLIIIAITSENFRKTHAQQPTTPE